jgi:hypothetical protein
VAGPKAYVCKVEECNSRLWTSALTASLGPADAEGMLVHLFTYVSLARLLQVAPHAHDI